MRFLNVPRQSARSQRVRKTRQNQQSDVKVTCTSDPIENCHPNEQLRPRRLDLKADAETILEYSASGKNKKTGYLEHHSVLFSIIAVHDLEFIGTPAPPIGIDNLRVNMAAQSSESSVGGIQVPRILPHPWMETPARMVSQIPTPPAGNEFWYSNCGAWEQKRRFVPAARLFIAYFHFLANALHFVDRYRPADNFRLYIR